MNTLVSNIETVFQNMQKIFNTYIEKYGKYSKANELAAYNFLYELIRLKYNNDVQINKEIQSEINYYSNYLNTYYKHNQFAVINTKKFDNIIRYKTDCGLHITKYKDEAFRKKYETTSKQALQLEHIKTLNSDSFMNLKSKAMYLFIINKKNQIRYFNIPTSTYNSIFNKNRLMLPGGKIAHPVMACQDNYEVIFSGEFVPIIENRSLMGIVFNNKSGHYMIDSENRDIALSSFNKIFENDSTDLIFIDVNYNK